MNFVKPAFEEFCLPVNYILYNKLYIKRKNYIFIFILKIFQTKKFADIIIPRGAENFGT